MWIAKLFCDSNALKSLNYHTQMYEMFSLDRLEMKVFSALPNRSMLVPDSGIDHMLLTEATRPAKCSVEKTVFAERLVMCGI